MKQVIPSSGAVIEHVVPQALSSPLGLLAQGVLKLGGAVICRNGAASVHSARDRGGKKTALVAVPLEVLLLAGSVILWVKGTRDLIYYPLKGVKGIASYCINPLRARL